MPSAPVQIWSEDCAGELPGLGVPGALDHIDPGGYLYRDSETSPGSKMKKAGRPGLL